MNFHMARGMAAPSQRMADLPRRQTKRRVQRIQNAGFSHARIARKDGEFSGKQRFQRFDPFPGPGAQTDGPNPGGLVNIAEFLSPVQIALVHQQQNVTAFQNRDARHTVNQKRVRFRRGGGGDNRHLIHVGNRRTRKGVRPGQNLFYIALAFARDPYRHPVPYQRAYAVFAKASARAAGDNLRTRIDVIETAQRLLNASRLTPYFIRVDSSPE